MTDAVATTAVTSEALPELANVYWRPRASEQSVRRAGWLWTLSTVTHTVPFLISAGVLVALKPITLPIGLIALAHAWIIPELYAARGVKVVRRPAVAAAAAERTAIGLLGDLLDHLPRELQAQTGLALERGRLGVWLVGPAGALLVARGGRRVHCYCVKPVDSELPVGDRIAHLLLALRTDEEGFVTIANLAFSGARWRVRRRLAPELRPALDAAAALARTRGSDSPAGADRERESWPSGQCTGLA